jgi:hypothetical protein
MANGNDPTYRRIPYWVRVRLKRLGNLCAHGCAAVAHAAHAEIGRIHRKYRLSRVGRFQAWLGGAAKAGVRKVTPKQMHGPLRVKASAPQQAPSRGQATPIRAKLPAEGARAPHGLGQTMADVRQRARDEKGARKQGRRRLLPRRKPQTRSAPQRQPAPKPDAMAQAQAAMRGAHQHPSRNGQQPTVTRTPLGVVAGPGRVPPLPGHPEAVRKAAEDKRSWSGLAKHLAGAPARVRTGRSRTRTTA